MKKAIHISVQGRVQGVGFRYHSRAKAQETGVTGFVRNLSDGSVYIEAEGEESALEMFKLWVSKGPSWANVTSMDISPASLTGFENFEIF
ncbi:MAG: acylphosphatase [Bacteroides sp.]|jgi:acylphosphatase|nr:acylphosphatase [Bacteroides sp.]